MSIRTNHPLSADEQRRGALAAIAAIKRRKQIWEALHPAGGTNCPTSLGDGRKAGPQHEIDLMEADLQADAAAMQRLQSNVLPFPPGQPGRPPC